MDRCFSDALLHRKHNMLIQVAHERIENNHIVKMQIHSVSGEWIQQHQRDDDTERA